MFDNGWHNCFMFDNGGMIVASPTVHEPCAKSRLVCHMCHSPDLDYQKRNKFKLYVEEYKYILIYTLFLLQAIF